MGSFRCPKDISYGDEAGVWLELSRDDPRKQDQELSGTELSPGKGVERSGEETASQFG